MIDLPAGVPVFWHQVDEETVPCAPVDAVLAAERERLQQLLNARESSALVQSETASEDGTLKWQARGRAEAYRYLLDHLASLDSMTGATHA